MPLFLILIKKKKKSAISLNRITKISKEMCINEIKREALLKRMEKRGEIGKLIGREERREKKRRDDKLFIRKLHLCVL